MIQNTIFDNSQLIFNWFEDYSKSIETLKNIDPAAPGITPTETVFSVENIKLLKYQNPQKATQKTPILISYALVNRFTIADLQDGKSFVQKLLQNGYEVYVVDWGYPTPADRFNDLDDYINYYLDSCVDYILNTHKIKGLNLLGICQGGTLSICYSALHPQKVKNLITMVTPVNFQTENDILSHMVQKMDVIKFTDAFGNLTGEILNTNFNMMQPISLNTKKWIDSVHSLNNEKMARFFLNMESWINDSPDQAGAAYKEFITNFYQQNNLYKKNLVIGGKKVDTQHITMPILNIFGSFDHLVPPEASKALADITHSKNYQVLEVRTGHIGMYVSGKAADVPDRIANWLNDQ